MRGELVIVLVAVIGIKGRVPSKTILEANFEQALMEDVPDTPPALLSAARQCKLCGHGTRVLSR